VCGSSSVYPGGFVGIRSHALLLANRSETNINRPWEPDDREIVETALAAYLHALQRSGGASSSEAGLSETFQLAGELPIRAKRIHEEEIQKHLRAGGRVLGAVAVSRTDPATGKIEYHAYLMATWNQVYRKLRNARNLGDKTYSNLDRLVAFIRDVAGPDVPIVTLPAGASLLRHFPGLPTEDTGPPLTLQQPSAPETTDS